ncbi:MAG: TIGR02757 family protein [Bacteroidetes bacterium]|nr:MAG: TIGR02757 family protein [Bacteroidota bacterium]
MIDRSIALLLNKKVKQYNTHTFIANDPIVIPHQFNELQNIEIMGFFAATFAWGQRLTIINKCNELIKRMGGNPYDFIMNHNDQDLKRLEGFKHRTFNDTDLLYFVHFFNSWYNKHKSLEGAFSEGMNKKDENIEGGLNHFRALFFSLPDAPPRTYKHVASPLQKSACKRINMFLRWMVRNDKQGVDFGLWKKISPSQLICPLDLHVQRVALKLGLLTREQSDWQAAVELTNALKQLDKNDPVKYDFALFGLGIMDKF